MFVDKIWNFFSPSGRPVQLVKTGRPNGAKVIRYIALYSIIDHRLKLNN